MDRLSFLMRTLMYQRFQRIGIGPTYLIEGICSKKAVGYLRSETARPSLPRRTEICEGNFFAHYAVG